MREYWITMTYVVDAHDEEEAAAIARKVCSAAETGTAYLVRDAEVQKVEEQ